MTTSINWSPGRTPASRKDKESSRSTFPLLTNLIDSGRESDNCAIIDRSDSTVVSAERMPAGKSVAAKVRPPFVRTEMS